MKSERRFSITPLVEALNLEPGASVSRALGVSGTRLASFAEFGVDERTAERLAVRAGFVPYLIWPELMDQAIADLEKVCAADDCDERFVPPLRQPYKRFCTARCKTRQQRRDQYRNDPVFREKAKASMRRYYAETREWQVKRSRWYREQAKRRAA